VTKDGLTVAHEIDIDNPFQNIGAQMAKEVASQTADNPGDGTRQPRLPLLESSKAARPLLSAPSLRDPRLVVERMEQTR
jgi:hypothetical protein